nr:Head fiber protein [Bacillus sp. AF23]
MKWADVTGKPSTFPPSSHTHTIANVTGLQTALDGKLTASKAASQANSTATDVEGLKADLNALLAKLKAAGQMA